MTKKEGYERIGDGLRIYIRPLEDEKEVERYFGANLLDRNILPVFIPAESKNKAKYFLLESSG